MCSMHTPSSPIILFVLLYIWIKRFHIHYNIPNYKFNMEQDFDMINKVYGVYLYLHTYALQYNYETIYNLEMTLIW